MALNKLILSIYSDDYMLSYVENIKRGLSQKDAYDNALTETINRHNLSYYFDRESIEYLKGVKVVEYTEKIKFN